MCRNYYQAEHSVVNIPDSCKRRFTRQADQVHIQMAVEHRNKVKQLFFKVSVIEKI